ncbi:MAG TPA: hypothetical protein VIN93_14290 [Bryobacteraceae bacterium]|jgi:hypothetical protein
MNDHAKQEHTSNIRFHRESKIFDPKDGFAPLIDPLSVTDATVARHGNQWWMCAGGKVKGKDGIHLFSASLPHGAPLSATGWTLTPDANNTTRVEILAGYDNSRLWDLQGGRHCPCYVKGWDPRRNVWVERIYYAGAADHFWGPYTIGYLEWDGSRWVDQPTPVFLANQNWEHGSVYEPNVIYFEGKWKMWYVAGSNQKDHIVQGFAESEDGHSDWSQHTVFIPETEKVFDFCVFPGRQGFEAVFSRVWFGRGAPPSRSGLWWCSAKGPYSDFTRWSEPVQIMTADDRGWHTGPWKPSAQHADSDLSRIFVFFDGMCQTEGPAAFPYAFTLGCLEIDRPV